jgi:hypothetical protein
MTGPDGLRAGERGRDATADLSLPGSGGLAARPG